MYLALLVFFPLILFVLFYPYSFFYTSKCFLLWNLLLQNSLIQGHGFSWFVYSPSLGLSFTLSVSIITL
jgi:hypothetical protein